VHGGRGNNECTCIGSIKTLSRADDSDETTTPKDRIKEKQQKSNPFLSSILFHCLDLKILVLDTGESAGEN
jgi:hypothetical protein